MGTVTTKDGVEIFYKDWGSREAQPIVFHHGWPPSSDDWDGQMLFFLAKGYRVIAHDRRGHGRSTQTGEGHDMDHYAADAAAVADFLDLRNAGADAGLLSVKLVKNGTLKIYPGFPHGMCTTHADVINSDLLTFIKG